MLSRKRVLVFHQSLAPYRVDLWNELNKYFDLEIYFIYENHLDQKFDQDRLKNLLDFTPQYLDVGLSVGNRAVRWGFNKIIKRFKPDIVISYEYSQTTTLLYLIQKLYSSKFCLYSICDDSLHIAETCSGLREIFRDFLAPKLDGLILVNEQVAKWYEQRFGGNKKRIVFPIIAQEVIFRENLSISIPQTNYFLQRYKLSGYKCLFYIGRLTAVKGIDRLIRVFNRVLKLRDKIKLVIIGEGNQSRLLKELALFENEKESVLFPGRFEGNQLLAWYNLAQIFILPSHYEPFGAVVNEALMAGSYVLCSSFAGASSLILEKVNGNLFNPYDEIHLQELMLEKLDQIQPLPEEIIDIRPSGMGIDFDHYFKNLNLQLTK